MIFSVSSSDQILTVHFSNKIETMSWSVDPGKQKMLYMFV